MMRKVIAKRTTEAKQQIPHFYLTIESNVDKLVEIRKQINENNKKNKISINDLLVKALAIAQYNNPDTQNDETQLYFTGEPQCNDYPTRCDIIQLPLYFDDGNNLFLKPNETLRDDPLFNYATGTYTLRFDFLD